MKIEDAKTYEDFKRLRAQELAMYDQFFGATELEVISNDREDAMDAFSMFG